MGFKHGAPELVKRVFNEAASGKSYVSASDLASFLRECQGMSGINDEQVAEIFSRIHQSSSTKQLDLSTFMKYLLDPTANAAMVVHEAPKHDMTSPLTHYYICTSHNSYLRGNQLTSKSCTSPIISALRNGCRVIELDCWERRGKVMVLHGGTLTRSIAFEDCIHAIKENAFVASEFPVIITIENHLPAALQQEAAKILKHVLGEMLYIPPYGTPPKEFLSPWELRRKIIISDKPPEEHLAKQVADDPKGAVEAIPSPTPSSKVSSSDSSDSYSSCSSENETTKDPKSKKNMERRIARKVKRTADALADHEFLAREVVQPTTKVPELQQLLYIYCAKPSEMANAPSSGKLCPGENAIMANLSEPQLKKSVAAHPTSLIQYTKSNLGRMYPFGLRFDSSNADPMLAWSHGFQLAAMNFQGKDRPCWVAHGFFRGNGGCGYIRKPDCFLRDEVDDNLGSLNPKLLLKVKVLMGTDWHKCFDLIKKPDFYVKVAIHGIPADKQKKRTSVAYKREEPNWETEEFIFPLRVPEIAVLRFEVWENDRMDRDDFVGQACMPVPELLTGIRVVALHSKKGVQRTSKLLCHFGLETML